MRIHVLGIGSIGTLLSHHLRLSTGTSRSLSAPNSICLHVNKSGLPTSLRGRVGFGKDERREGRREGRSEVGDWREEVLESVESGSREVDGRSAGEKKDSLIPYSVQLSVIRENKSKTTSQGFSIELSNPHISSHPFSINQRRSLIHRLNLQGYDCDSTEPIESLVVTLKCPDTLPAIKAIQHRIQPNSVITLLQNGMGVYDELCERVWPDKTKRPQFILGTTTHGAAIGGGWSAHPLGPRRVGEEPPPGVVLKRTIEHHGMGDIKLSVIPDPRGEVDFDGRLFSRSDTPGLPLPSLSTHEATAPSPLEQTLAALLAVTSLNTSLLPTRRMHHQLLLKLVINAAINPITAILGVKNGELIGNSSAHRLIREVAEESSHIILTYLTSLQQSSPDSDSSVSQDLLMQFNPTFLERQIISVCSRTATNTSSMLADVTHGKRTEIEYINGYLVALGKRLGVKTPVNEMLMWMLKAKAVSMR